MEEKDLIKDSNLPEEGATDLNAVKETVNEDLKVEEVVVNDAAESNEPIVTVNDATAVVESDRVEGNTKAVAEEMTKEDYSDLTRTELLTKLNGLINHHDVEAIKDAVEDIKLNFYKKYKAESVEAFNKFIEEGGKKEDFKFFDDASELTFKEIYSTYKDKKGELLKHLEEEKKANLKKKYDIVDGIKELINKEESINKTFQEFRDLQQQWHEIGLVPQNEVKGLWENYHHIVEQFYDYININKELRDLDLKKNLEEKIKLCEKAEALLIEESVTKAFKTLQEFHTTWREIGPVPRDQKDDIWERFKAITSQINKKHQDYFEGLKEQQVDNLEQKTALCEKVEEIVNAPYDKPKDWEDRANELIEIQKLWRTIGFAPKKDNNKIYHRFKGACDAFFAKKRDYYKVAKDEQKNNLQLKLDLCVQAEALKDSKEWKKTTEDYIKLQKRWKEIGTVPKKQSEALWRRFRGACDAFFKSKDEFFNTVDSRQEDNLKLKKELIEKVKSFVKSDNEKETLEQLMAIQKEWSDVGFVPIAHKDEIQKEFRSVINEQFEKLKIDEDERSQLNFKSKVDTWVNSNSKSKLYSERNKLVVKIKELENEVLLYENNIGFFTSSKKSNKMIEEINRKIELAKERMASYKQKLKMLDSAEDDA